MEIIKYKKKFKKKKILKVQTRFLGSVQFGYYGIKALNNGILNSTQVEYIRRFIIKISKKIGKLIIRLYFQHPLTEKPLLSRMGKGVGNISVWITYIKKGFVFLELTGISNKLIIKIFNKLCHKLPFKIRLISRDVLYYKIIA